MSYFTNKHILITGHNGSLGSALVNTFMRDGAKVLGLPKGLRGKSNVEAQLAGLTREPVDFVVLNDGINHLSWIGETPETDSRIMEVNVMQPYWVLNAVVAAQPDHPATVLFITSQTYRVSQRTTSLYCASKAALNALMRTAARELAPKGWVVNALAPGKIEDTDMSRKTDAQVLALRGWSQQEADGYAKKLVPAGRNTDTHEVVAAVKWALLAPRYVNGATLELMGGV